MAYRSVAVLALPCLGVLLFTSSNLGRCSSPPSCSSCYSSPKSRPPYEPVRLAAIRDYRVTGMAGRLPIERTKLEGIITERGTEQISMPPRLPDVTYNQSLFGEILLIEVLAHETYFDGVPRRDVTTVRRLLKMWMPIMIKGEPGLLQLGDITDSPSRASFPNQLNRNTTYKVDSITDSWGCGGQIVEYRIGDESVLRMTLQYNGMCNGDTATGTVQEDYDQITGTALRSLPVVGGLDWGCDDVAANYGYCKELIRNRDALAAAGGNVCVEYEATDVRRCPKTSGWITEVSGQFLEWFPFLPDTANTGDVIFEIENIEREARTTVVSPCF